ncbi:hypothetical protein HanHA300_Chr01g0035081 [Helianthus annuus]|nr:hypothetical protein HanHA300_Chr01g0035081 [Helianthus annuus]KAJ0784828.1 hypothetical protein HanLR1_Chr01g0036141 [Helianthus annuus]
MLLSFTRCQSLLLLFDHIKLPKVFTAKGSPLHFTTISLPIGSSLRSSSPTLPCANACFLNNNHDFSSDKHPSSCCNSPILAIIRQVFSDRVVITTVLPSAPQLNVPLKVFHFPSSFSSAQTSSSTIKNFLPVNLFWRSSCNVSSCVSVHPDLSTDSMIFFIITLTWKFSETYTQHRKSKY